MLFFNQIKRITTSKPISIGLVVLLVATGFIGMITFESDIASAYTVHGTIRIDGDTDFATQAGIEGWSGDGSETNPYIIENYDINGTGNGTCIYIGNTTS
jgi:ABC-type phosphate transport system substrate-binding protein